MINDRNSNELVSIIVRPTKLTLHYNYHTEDFKAYMHDIVCIHLKSLPLERKDRFSGVHRRTK